MGGGAGYDAQWGSTMTELHTHNDADEKNVRIFLFGIGNRSNELHAPLGQASSSRDRGCLWYPSYYAGAGQVIDRDSEGGLAGVRAALLGADAKNPRAVWNE
jgi:hypothetical protein